MPCRLFQDGADGKGHYILRMRLLDALFLVSLNLRNSKLVNKNNAEVDATGRCITVPVVCIEGALPPSRTLLGALLYTNGVGVSSVYFLQGFSQDLKKRISRSTDTPLSFFVADKN